MGGRFPSRQRAGPGAAVRTARATGRAVDRPPRGLGGSPSRNPIRGRGRMGRPRRTVPAPPAGRREEDRRSRSANHARSRNATGFRSRRAGASEPLPTRAVRSPRRRTRIAMGGRPCADLDPCCARLMESGPPAAKEAASRHRGAGGHARRSSLPRQLRAALALPAGRRRPSR